MNSLPIAEHKTPLLVIP